MLLPIPTLRTATNDLSAREMYGKGFAGVMIKYAEPYQNMHFAFMHPDNGFIPADRLVSYDEATCKQGIADHAVPKLLTDLSQYLEDHKITSILVVANNMTLDAFTNWPDYSRVTLTMVVQNLGIAYRCVHQWLKENRITNHDNIPRFPKELTRDMWSTKTGMVNFRVAGIATFGGVTVAMDKKEVADKIIEITQHWPPLKRVQYKYCIVNGKLISAVRLANALAGHDHARVKSSDRAKVFLNKLGVAVFLPSRGH